jgi:hypothetical protein
MITNIWALIPFTITTYNHFKIKHANYSHIEHFKDIDSWMVPIDNPLHVLKWNYGGNGPPHYQGLVSSFPLGLIWVDLHGGFGASINMPSSCSQLILCSKLWTVRKVINFHLIIYPWDISMEITYNIVH